MKELAFESIMDQSSCSKNRHSDATQSRALAALHLVSLLLMQLMLLLRAMPLPESNDKMVQ